MKTSLVILGLASLLEGAGWRSDFDEARRLEAEGRSGAERAGRIYESLAAGAEALPPLESNALALELFYAGRYTEAEAAYGAALAGWDRLGAAGLRDRIVTAANLGTLLRAEGRFRCCWTLCGGPKHSILPARARTAWNGAASPAAWLLSIWPGRNSVKQNRSPFGRRRS